MMKLRVDSCGGLRTASFALRMFYLRHIPWLVMIRYCLGFRGGPESDDKCRTRVGGKPDISESL